MYSRTSTSPPKDTFYESLCIAAIYAVRTLKQRDIPSAIVGGLACHLFGNTRKPCDVDMLVLPRSTLHCDAEDVKRWIVEDCAKFILKPSRKIGATYKILYFRSASMGDIKIDILLPGTTHLPALPLDRIVHSDPIKVQGKTYTLPLAPPALLLLFKLQAWSDRLTEYRFRTKCELDASDLRCMLKLKAVTDLRTTQPWHDRSLFSSTFEMLTKGRVERFCARFPQCRNDWKSLGFDTGPELRGSSLYLDFQNLRI